MKRFIFTISMFFLFIVNVDAQDNGHWEILNEGEGYFWYIDFINDDVGWMAGYGKLMKTEDGGEFWNTISDEPFYSFEFINDSIGWAIDNSSIKKSIDGGYTWETQKRWDDLHLNNLFAVNDSVVFVMDGDAIKKTIDGGQNWIDISPNEDGFTSLWFFTADFGIVISSSKGSDDNTKIFKTLDGGQVWNELLFPEYSHIDKLQFINDSTGYFLVSNGYLGRTTDTLNTWSIDTSNAYIPSCIIDEKTIFAITDDSVFLSKDGGLTWGNKQYFEEGLLTKLYFSSPQVGYLISQNGRWSNNILWKTTDQGATWTKQIFSYPFTDVWFKDNNMGFAMGGWDERDGHELIYGGNVYATNDGGMTWKNTFKTGWVRTCFFVNDVTGFLLSTGWLGRSSISKTTDFGENWVEVYRNISWTMGYIFTGNDLSFMNDQSAWAVGEYHSEDWDTSGAAVLGTNDGGENWDLIWKYPNAGEYSYTLNSIQAIGEEAWAVGEYGMIVKYTKQDQWQVESSITDLPLNKVYFYNQQHGWISGGYFYEDNFYLKLFKTIDGGQTWKDIPNISYQINDLHFADSLHGWAVGNDTSGGMILETLDGGYSWIPQVEGLSNPLTAIHFKEGVGWAVGGNGLVLRTDNWTTWINPNTGEVYPKKYQISQNYPNPFNPSTTIEFTLPKSEFVTLRVYNLLGQEVKILVSEKLEPGFYKYTWDASDFASGIYFYRLETEKGFVQSRKLILLK